MATIKTERTGTINAVDVDGNRYTIIKYTDFYVERRLDGTIEKLEGHSSYQLSNGEHLNKISDSEFYAIASDLQLFVK